MTIDLNSLTIPERIAAVRENMQSACNEAGRAEDSVRLIAVTKYVDTEHIQQAIDCGLREVGENHAQELTQKLTFFKLNGCTPHFIGQLQTNKIKYVCGVAEMIHSVDRLHLAEELNKKAASMGITQKILLQVNIGDEEQKGGIDRGALLDLLGQVAEMKNLEVHGLMCVPPAMEAKLVRPYFASMRELLEKAREIYPALPLTELSMGMTHDYREAILEGATMVRVGTGIFGPRNYGLKQ